MKLTFLGAVGTATGSKYLLDTGDARILIDCGLFQGFKQLRLRNWAPLPVDPRAIDAVVLTHAHLDHTGYLPLLVKNGFRGPVFATSATADLCGILLPDSGHLQEKDAEFANRHGTSDHKPALPLYTMADAQAALKAFKPAEFGASVALPGGLTARFLPAGHILGAAIVEITGGPRKIVFSGDLGRPSDPTMPDPTPVESADYLLIESTYGDRKHNPVAPEDALLAVISRTFARGGTVVIPAFAVGRAQTLMYHLHKLVEEKKLHNIPVFLDSPMAVSASNLFTAHPGDHSLTKAETAAVFDTAHYVNSVEESKALDTNPMPKVIISASGMATGGRVLHHLKRYAPDPRNAILFAGYQAGGTRGAEIVGGAKEVWIFGEKVPIRAEVGNLGMLSGHADADEIIAWLRNFKAPPRMTFIVHGEPQGADALRKRVEHDLHWPVTVPEYLQVVELV